MSFGWHRAEVLGAILSVQMIWVVTGLLVYMALLRIISIDAKVMLITSGLSVLVNIIIIMSPPPHGAEHGHGGVEEIINVKATFNHVFGDFLHN